MPIKQGKFPVWLNIFGDDSVGQVTYFIWKFQYKNQPGIKIHSASVLIYENEEKLAGNSGTNCGVISDELNVGGTEQCEKIL